MRVCEERNPFGFLELFFITGAAVVSGKHIFLFVIFISKRGLEANGRLYVGMLQMGVGRTIECGLRFD